MTPDKDNQPDFKAALKWLDTAQEKLLETLAENQAPMHPDQLKRYGTIRQALVIADKLSEETTLKQFNEWCELQNGNVDVAHFNTWVASRLALKEIV